MKRTVTTLCIIQRKNKVLLGMKKRGFGSGKWNGFGGKVSLSETTEEAAKRELLEEAGISSSFLVKLGVIEFEYAKTSEISETHIFKASEFSGDPKESEEMSPKWFDIKDIPFDAMWPDDRYWVPLLLKGKKFKGKFLFGESNDILRYDLAEVEEI